MAGVIGRIAFDRRCGGLRIAFPNAVPVFIHWSILFPAVFLTQPLWGRGAFVRALLFVLMLLASILLHEIGHVLAAGRERVRSEAILIHLLGGAALLRVEAGQKYSAIRIALAGPAVNLGLAALFLAIAWATSEPQAKTHFGRVVMLTSDPLPHLAYLGALLNIGLAVVNLIPAFDLDGGVIARESLMRFVGFRSATLLVGLSGLAFATLSNVVFVASALGGWPIWVPPSYLPNWAAVRRNWRRKA